jgi:hypothetical protein
MRGKPMAVYHRAFWWQMLAVVWSVGMGTFGAASAQTNPSPLQAPKELSPAGADKVVPPDAAPTENPIQQVGCSSCGGLLGKPSFGMGPCGPSGCGGSSCVPGRTGDFCDGCLHDTWVGRCLGGIYDCICCPDPCYEPRWTAVANAAFFADGARPQTQMRLRWDSDLNLQSPDRAEYYWAAPNAAQGKKTGTGEGQRTSSGRGPKGGVALNADIREFSLYTEGAADRVGAFVEIPYRRSEPENPNMNAFSGFSDMNVGTKTLLLDCELLQIAFQFKTFIPIGQATKGLGTGHVSLEPSLLWALKLTSETYFQAQTAYWIPIGGDQVYAGDIFHYHLSLNHLLCRPIHGIQLIGTAEMNGWAILDGSFSIPDPQAAGKALPQDTRRHILSAGPGIRLDICEKIDFGLGTAFALTSHKWADQMYRAEFRWRF